MAAPRWGVSDPPEPALAPRAGRGSLFRPSASAPCRSVHATTAGALRHLVISTQPTGPRAGPRNHKQLYFAPKRGRVRVRQVRRASPIQLLALFPQGKTANDSLARTSFKVDMTTTQRIALILGLLCIWQAAPLPAQTPTPTPATTVYVSDRVFGRVLKFDSAGQMTVFLSGINWPSGLTFDNVGNLYVASGADTG